ncbi:GHKL domain-containing protein [Hungatella sp.]|uniref:GHKL domain-containing protein n=1 Tax=Hungatella sp. TaxID=2613924 RepID=UPI00258B1837|nr:GHKL domain-containing protein [Hungatella sp.]MCI6455737.1 ATP-binding protein [Hungatella sp.]
MELGKLILTIDNSTGPGDAEYKSSTGLGIGQSSVKAVAQKYHGSVRFEFKEDIYKASVLMVMPVSEKVQE